MPLYLCITTDEKINSYRKVYPGEAVIFNPKSETLEFAIIEQTAVKLLDIAEVVGEGK